MAALPEVGPVPSPDAYDCAPPPPWREIVLVVCVVLLVVIVTWLSVRHARRKTRTPHPPEEVVVRAGDVDRTNPPDPRDLEVPDPDLIVVRYPTTYWMEEPS